MQIRKAFKYRLKTNSGDEALFSRHAGCCRFVWNKALALQKERLADGDYCLNYESLANLLPQWKQEHPFLSEAPSQALQQVLKNLDKALKEAFDKKNPKRFPNFKKKFKSVDSFRYPQGFKVEGNRIFLPKVGWRRFINSRLVTGIAKNATVSRRGKHWFVSIQTEFEFAEPQHPSNSIIGGDRGVKRFITLSNGKSYEPLGGFRKMERQLAKEQRKLARKVKRSKNWRKQKERITRLHIRIADARSDYLHKVSSEVSKNHAVVVLEDLQVKNMTASAKGKSEAPGKNVKQKSGLNKSILDQGWGEFGRQLEYKQAWRGGWVLYVPAAYTSQTCSQCNHVSPGNRKSQELFVCENCGHTANADENAAINIERAGHARLACQANGAVMPSATGTSRIAA
jgi:putative transposase